MGFYGLHRDYRVYVKGIHWDNGKEDGNYYLGFRV